MVERIIYGIIKLSIGNMRIRVKFIVDWAKIDDGELVILEQRFFLQFFTSDRHGRFHSFAFNPPGHVLRMLTKQSNAQVLEFDSVTTS